MLLCHHLRLFHLTLWTQRPCYLKTTQNGFVSSSENSLDTWCISKNLFRLYTMLGRMCYSLKRMFDILEPYWRGGKATKRGRMSTRWQGWASRYECDGETWFVGAAARCRCSWLQWPCRELETQTRAPACTGGPPVRRMRRNNVIL